MPGGKATVREPPESEKTKIYTGGNIRSAGSASAQPQRSQPPAEPQRPQTSAQPQRSQPPARPAAQASVSPARQQIHAQDPAQRPVRRQAPAQQPRQPRKAGAQPVHREPARQQRGGVQTQVKQSVAAAADTVKKKVQTAERDVSGAIRRADIPKSRLYAVLGFLGALVLVIVLSAAIASGSGAHGVVKKLAHAYDHQSAAEMMALGGGLMQALYPDAEMEAECRENIDVVRDVFSDRLGSRYRFGYSIALGKTYKGSELKTRLESTYGDLGGAFDLSQVEAMTSATLTLQARHGGAKAEKRVQQILVKENGKWKLASQLV